MILLIQLLFRFAHGERARLLSIDQTLACPFQLIAIHILINILNACAGKFTFIWYAYDCVGIKIRWRLQNKLFDIHWIISQFVKHFLWPIGIFILHANVNVSVCVVWCEWQSFYLRILISQLSMGNKLISWWWKISFWIVQMAINTYLLVNRIQIEAKDHIGWLQKSHKLQQINKQARIIEHCNDNNGVRMIQISDPLSTINN